MKRRPSIGRSCFHSTRETGAQTFATLKLYKAISRFATSIHSECSSKPGHQERGNLRPIHSGRNHFRYLQSHNVDIKETLGFRPQVSHGRPSALRREWCTGSNLPSSQLTHQWCLRLPPWPCSPLCFQNTYIPFISGLLVDM